MSYRFRLVGVSGTFDRLHVGHKALIRKAFEVSERVMIGLTTSRMAQHKTLANKIEPYAMRKKKLESFLKQEGYLDRAEIISLDDPYGPAIMDAGLEALVATEETLPGVKKINIIRKEKGLPPLEIVLVPLIPAQDGQRISSTRIREGKINEQGNLLK
ncbi:MAG: phosphopantetheine adenylyltransferase [Candidatus Freyarchaeota archaeon]|nr:phosphopantetheine adenylyltransferase [Candidatus Jordarchaeia archaeon]MBS7267400.1 phosphopantetheine adenylyltransferase [Candidatus Jordarchaeia archaeon]MBS7278705.1 phosphopantetheine adenylyltransferase [Candidatus Jordarchaeia archaeon]